jgi:hypothetical protein
MVTVELIGIQELSQAFGRLAAQAGRAMVQAVQAEAERILEASQPLVPVDTGNLRSTGTVLRDAHGAEIRYGGFGAAPYSIVVHERTDVRHPVGQHHFLSQPVFEATADMAQRLAQDVAHALRG